LFIEFPKVFADKNGFDIILGNPPHGSKLSTNEKEILRKQEISLYSLRESAILFLVRASNLVNRFGCLGIVVPKQFAYNDGWTKIRAHLYKDYQITEILDLGNAFSGQTNEQLVIFWSIQKQQISSYKVSIFDDNFIKKLPTIPFEFYEHLHLFPLGLDLQEIEIGTQLIKNFSSLDFIDGARGIPAKKTMKERWDIPCFEKKNLERYYLLAPKEGISKNLSINKVKRLRREKLVAQRITSFTTVPTSRLIIKAYYDNMGLIFKSTVVFIVINEEDSPPLNYLALCTLLNSKIVSWYAQRFIYTKFFETSKDLDVKYLKRVKIPNFKSDQTNTLSLLAQYLLFLNSSKDKRQKNKEIIDFFNEVADFLLYESYFLNKLYEDPIYTKGDSCLYEDIFKNLTKIPYEEWSKLYWKDRFQDNIDQKQELKGLEEKILNTILKIYEILINDTKVEEYLGVLKKDKWIQKINEIK